LHLPKDINHSEPSQLISYHFIKVPADRFYNNQSTDRPGDDCFGLSDSDSDVEYPHDSGPQFWYSKDCKTEEEYLEKKAAASLIEEEHLEKKAAASLLKLRLNSELHDE